MPVKSFKMGDGALTVSISGGAVTIEMAIQVRAMVIKVAEKVKTVDPIPVLSGDELEGEEVVTHDYTLVGNVIQDIDNGGLTDLTWQHAGVEADFTFQPTDAANTRTATGVCVIVPLDFGGDVDPTKRPEAPVNWRVKGIPILS